MVIYGEYLSWLWPACFCLRINCLNEGYPKAQEPSLPLVYSSDFNSRSAVIVTEITTHVIFSKDGHIHQHNINNYEDSRRKQIMLILPNKFYFPTITVGYEDFDHLLTHKIYTDSYRNEEMVVFIHFLTWNYIIWGLCGGRKRNILLNNTSMIFSEQLKKELAYPELFFWKIVKINPP